MLLELIVGVGGLIAGLAIGFWIGRDRSHIETLRLVGQMRLARTPKDLEPQEPRGKDALDRAEKSRKRAILPQESRV